MEEIKSYIEAQAIKVKGYDNRMKQFQNIRIFSCNQGRFFKRTEGEDTVIPSNTEKVADFWWKWNQHNVRQERCRTGCDTWILARTFTNLHSKLDTTPGKWITNGNIPK